MQCPAMSQCSSLSSALASRSLGAPLYKVAKLGSGDRTRFMAAVTVGDQQHKTYPRTFPSQQEAEEAVAGIALAKMGVAVEERKPAGKDGAPSNRPDLAGTFPLHLPAMPRPPQLPSMSRPPQLPAMQKPPQLPAMSSPPSPPASVCSTTSTRHRKKCRAEELFQASLAADNDSWLEFQIQSSVPARSQLVSLQQWLGRHPPSRVARSQGVGWIAVKLRDKGRKVVEAKVAWEERGAGGSMAVVDGLAQEFQVLGGKWMCHLPTDRIDAVWSRVAVTLLSGGLGSPVYMVKVSPLEDVNLEQADGEHVLIVYNTDYRDTEQVMRVENLLRSAGVTSALNYKPDVFSALGIYRNNRWGCVPPPTGAPACWPRAGAGSRPWPPASGATTPARGSRGLRTRWC